MPVVELFDSRGLGIIISFPIGIIFSNQTGGTSCRHPRLEGCFFPLRNDYDHPSFENDLMAHFEGPKWRGSGATAGIDEQDADIIDEILTHVRLSGAVKVDRDRLKESHEAWVFLLINDDDEESLFTGFGPYPRTAVLTWFNSD